MTDNELLLGIAEGIEDLAPEEAAAVERLRQRVAVAEAVGEWREMTDEERVGWADWQFESWQDSPQAVDAFVAGWRAAENREGTQ